MLTQMSNEKPPLINRESELKRMEQLFGSVIALKTPKFLLIEGDYGLGKTALEYEVVKTESLLSLAKLSA